MDRSLWAVFWQQFHGRYRRKEVHIESELTENALGWNRTINWATPAHSRLQPWQAWPYQVSWHGNGDGTGTLTARRTLKDELSVFLKKSKFSNRLRASVLLTSWANENWIVIVQSTELCVSRWIKPSIAKKIGDTRHNSSTIAQINRFSLNMHQHVWRSLKTTEASLSSETELLATNPV